MGTGTVNLIKLCVGATRVEDLAAWQAARGAGDPDYLPRHVTRMWPKREAELLNGGALYWVFKGMPTPRRAFQGWRYLPPEDAPRDLSSARAHEDPLPVELQAALAEIGVR